MKTKNEEKVSEETTEVLVEETAEKELDSSPAENSEAPLPVPKEPKTKEKIKILEEKISLMEEKLTGVPRKLDKAEVLLNFIQKRAFGLYSTIPNLLDIRLDGEKVIMTFSKKPDIDYSFDFEGYKITPEIELQIKTVQETVTTLYKEGAGIEAVKEPVFTPPPPEQMDLVSHALSEEQNKSLGIKEIPPPFLLGAKNKFAPDSEHSQLIAKWKARHKIPKPAVKPQEKKDPK